MTSACVIAACAAGGYIANTYNNQNEQNPAIYAAWSQQKGSILYYRVNFRLYLHFNSINIVENTGDFYVGSVFAPIRTTLLNTVTVEPKTIARSHKFSIDINKCPEGISKYVESNIEKFTNSSVWQAYKEDIINKYLEDIQIKYNVILDKDALDYTTQYCWEIEYV